ncbi:hypothetical protein DL766_000224 [Monosporascus sp. MC13-8B]|uniref:DNA2/NAM7 helicase-like C-terminal domain-containing protein n=1 Tax=Monosporascus cannonballus TaxID=155416 RepID=A0ABY0GY22_9PEZI|nr:hypothetical protein DL762_009356 [Monosporascus cannonballus]RYO83776.1 hypothetical protein DL763_007739 [Monosporascus cannonballus]RYP39782.1 hypothetical protein DL766_000224 [Monosporascus sp. MC13-8B]
MSLWKALAQKSYGEIIKRVRGGPFPLFEPKRKPRLRSAKHNFSNLEEYLAILGVSAKIEQGLKERNQRCQFQGNIRVLQSETRNKSTVLLSIPEHCREYILPGDKAKVYFEAEEQPAETEEWPEETDEWFKEVGQLPEESGERPENSGHGRQSEKRYWDLRFIEPLPFSSPGIMTAVLQRPSRKKATASTDDSKYIIPPYIPWPRDRSAAEAMSYIMENEGVRCKVKTVPRQSIYPYVFEALEELRQTKGQAMSKVVADVALTRAKWRLYAKEERHLQASAVKPFFLDTEIFHRILLTSAGNKGADSMAAALHKQLQGLHKESLTRKHAYVIRLYSIKTEREIFLADARASRRKKLNPKSEMMPGTMLPHSSQETRDAITTHFQIYAKEKFEGVDDDRVQNIELALGTRMKQMAGIQPDDNVPIIQDEPFLRLYSRFNDGGDLSPKETEEFEAGIERLMGHAIQNAAAISATVTGAVNSLVTRNYREAELIVVDEAARVPEYQWWPLLAFYPNAVGKIMVGDPDQLPPYVDEGEVRNPFASQLGLSLQARLQPCLPSTFLKTQYRAAPAIASIYNNACYGGRLESDVSTKPKRRPLAQDIIRHNLKYKRASCVVFFDVPEAKEKGDEHSHSKYCDESAHCVMVLLEDLLNAGFKPCETRPLTIAILTPYKAQHKRLSYAKTIMSEQGFPEAAEVALGTIDKAQGMEYDIVIVDMVVTMSPGFLNKNRLNVMLSRARCGLYVIGNYSAWKEMRSDDSVPLRRIASQLGRFRMPWPSAQARTSRFYPFS